MALFRKKEKQSKMSKETVNQLTKIVTPQYSGNRILTKTYCIGDFTFTVGITRLLALDGLQKTPRYWDIIQSDLSQKINSPDFNYFEFIKENPHTNITEFLKMQEEVLDCSEQIVRYLLPEMLRLGKTNITGYKDYQDYAKQLLKFCEKNGILYDWQEDIEEDFDNDISEEQALEIATSKYNKGLINKLMELVQLGFTQGSSPSMPKIKITEM